MQTSNVPTATAFTGRAPNLRDDEREPGPESVVHHDEPALVAKAVKGLASLAVFPEVRLDAVRVLALALTTALESQGENDVRRGPSIRIRDEVQRFEATLIRSALRYTGGRQRRAARLLGMNVSTLNSRIKRYKLNAAEIEVE